MYRILSCSKDAYITSKYIAGSRSFNANTGQAGTIDLYKLYGETKILSGSTVIDDEIELTRGLLKFDLSPIVALTSSILNVGDSSFKAYLHMKDVYGGQTTPSNFTLEVIPVSKSWDEGRGRDVISFRDKDAVNWLTASINNGTSLWNEAGANAKGLLGSNNIDLITSGNLGIGVQSTTASFAFARGDEDLFVEVTSLVSGTVVGLIPDHGWRISFSNLEETDNQTRFVKRFGSRQANPDLQPRLVVKYNDVLQDDNSKALFGSVPNNIFLYNSPNGIFQNFVLAGNEVSGSNCLLLELVGSKWVSYWTSSYSTTHSASINHLTRSLSTFTQQFSGSSVLIGYVPLTGYYSASVVLDPTANSELNAFLSGSTDFSFTPYWKSSDASYVFATGSVIQFSRKTSTISSLPSQNVVVSMFNLQNTYTRDQVARLRVFVQDYSDFLVPSKFSRDPKPSVKKNMFWRMVDGITKQVIIPFDDVATKTSYDGDGNYFDFWMSDLVSGQVYEFEFKISENGKDTLIQNNGFIFKVS